MNQRMIAQVGKVLSGLGDLFRYMIQGKPTLSMIRSKKDIQTFYIQQIDSLIEELQRLRNMIDSPSPDRATSLKAEQPYS